MNKMAQKFWLAFCREAEGEGGAGGGGTESGTAGGEGAAAAGMAGSEAAAPAQTFLGEAAGKADAKTDADTGTDAKPIEGAADAPAAFDLSAVKLAEGFTLSEETGKAFADLLSKPDLAPQERGQQLIDLHQSAVQEAVKAATESATAAAKETYDKLNTEWRTAIKELPEFKADPEAEAGKVYQVLLGQGKADKAFFDAMDLTGAGNNPAVMQVLHRLTKPFFEGAAVGGNGKVASGRKLGSNIYTSAADART